MEERVMRCTSCNARFKLIPQSEYRIHKAALDLAEMIAEKARKIAEDNEIYG